MRTLLALAISGLLLGTPLALRPPEPWTPPEVQDIPVPEGLTIPPRVYQVAAHYILLRVGPEAFAEHFRFNASATGLNGPQCEPLDDNCAWSSRIAFHSVVFDYVEDGLPPQPTGIGVHLEGELAHQGPHPFYGLPDCRAAPLECEILVDGDDALAAARKAGLQDHGYGFDVAFGWRIIDEGGQATFGWSVSEKKAPVCGHSEGLYASVDGQTGRVLETGRWSLNADCW